MSEPTFGPTRWKNWYSAIGMLFIIMAGIVLVRQLFLWGPEFVIDFMGNSQFTNEKLSLSMIGIGLFMIIIGAKKYGKTR